MVLAVCFEMDKGIFLLFGITNKFRLGAIQDFTETFRMPFLTPSVATREITEATPGYMIHMRPVYNHAMVAVMRHYKWMKVHYIYDTEEGEMRGAVANVMDKEAGLYGF